MTIKKLAAGVLAFGLLVSSATGAAAAEKVVAYDEAVALAVKNNSSLSDLLDNVKVMERTRSDLSQALNFSVDASTPVTVAAEYITALTTLNTMQISLDNVKYSKEMIEGGAEFAVLSSFSAIKNAERTLEMVTKSCELARKNDEFNQLKFRLGMISQSELKASKNEYEKIIANKTLAELGLENEYTGLSRLLGLNLNLEYGIEFAREFTPMEKTATMDSYVSRRLSGNPYLKLMEGSVSGAEFSKNLYSSGEGIPYEKKEYDSNSAGRAYADAKADLDKSIRETYNSALQLEAMGASLNAALETAMTDYAVAEANYAVGNINEYMLEQARLGVLSAEAALWENTYSHEMLKFLLDNSYLLAGQ